MVHINFTILLLLFCYTDKKNFAKRPFVRKYLNLNIYLLVYMCICLRIYSLNPQCMLTIPKLIFL